jgi:hypothetical protein
MTRIRADVQFDPFRALSACIRVIRGDPFFALSKIFATRQEEFFDNLQRRSPTNSGTGASRPWQRQGAGAGPRLSGLVSTPMWHSNRDLGNCIWAMRCSAG